MRSTFMGLETSKRSLFAHQTALQTTGHNISNANTKGYSRQVVNFVASIPMEEPGLQRSNTPGQLGTGVEFDYIKRIRESFLDDQFMSESKEYGQWLMRADTLEKLEVIVNEPSDTGIRQVIEGFLNAWQELSKAPENMTARVLVKERALALADAFNHTAAQLNNLKTDLTTSISIKANRVDMLLGQVAGLNQEIYRIEGLDNNANDLRDQRNLIIDELSQLININVEEISSGYTVRMGTVQLVNGNQKPATVDAAFLQGNFGTELNSGEIYGMIYSRDNHVQGYIDDLNQLVDSIANGQMQMTLPAGMVIPNGATVGGVTYSGTIAARTLAAPLTVTVNGINELHQLGYKLDGTRGEPFFTMTGGEEAMTLTVNPNIVSDVAGIVSSNRVVLDAGNNEIAVKGNNELALLMAGSRILKVNGNGTIDEMFQAIVGKLGIQTQEATRESANMKVLVDQVESRRQSISGVSLDEEMANMIKFQHAYNASARAMTAFDEMLDKVINGMGIVGR